MDIDIFKVMSVVNPLIGASLVHYIDNTKVQRTKATTAFKKILDKREIFEEYLADLLTLSENSDKTDKQRYFSKAYTKYCALYNEIEEFCGEVIAGSIKSKKYIKGSVYNSLCEYAKLQVEFYVKLRDYSKKYGLEPVKKTSIGSYINFDEFLKKYSGGDKSHFWLELSNLRRDSDF